jgi:hypothetical protein
MSISRVRVFFGLSDHRLSIGIDSDHEFTDEDNAKLIASTKIDEIQLETQPAPDVYSIQERYAANVAKKLKDGFEFNQLKLTIDDEDEYYLNSDSMYLKKKEKNDRYLSIPLGEF